VQEEYQAVASALAQQAEAVALTLLGAPVSRSRQEWRWGKPDNPSLKVTLAGPYKGRFVDFAAGAHGDLLGLAARTRFGGDQGAALTWAKAFLGTPQGVATLATPRTLSASPQGQREAPSVSSTQGIARQVWHESQTPEGTLVEAYLASRGLGLDPGLPIRFHPQCRRGEERLPAMVALMTDPATGEPCGVHRTFLRSDGSGKAPGQARAMLGTAGAIRLSPDADVTRGLAIAEGIETALSVGQGFGWRPVWSVTSASMIRAFPILHGIEALTVFADGDAAGQAAAEACATRWAEAGREASIMVPPAGLDLNDLHRGIAA
jgi:putative DNA primase/helicase